MNLSACEEEFKPRLRRRYEDSLNYTHKNYKYPPIIWKTLDDEDTIKIVAYIVIIVGGLLGNISVILTVARKRSMWTTINFYIANLAVADAMTCLTCMVPQLLQVFTGGYFVLGAFMCKFSPFSQMTCLTSSVLTLCAISCDRFMAVIFPLRSRVTKQRTSVVTTIIWAISIIVSIPFLIVNRHRTVLWKNFVEPQCFEAWPSQPYYDESLRKCSEYKPLLTTYYVASSLILFFLPVLIMIVAYFLILRRLWTAKLPGERNAAIVNTYSRAKKKVIKMVFVVLVVFILCWAPYQVKILYFAFRPKGQPTPAWMTNYFNWFSYYLAFSNSFLNPIVYSGFNKGFREVFFGVLQCGYRRKEKYGSTTRRKLFNIRRTWSPPQLTSDTMDDTTKSSKKRKLKYQISDTDTSSTTLDTYVSTIYDNEADAFA